MARKISMKQFKPRKFDKGYDKRYDHLSNTARTYHKNRVQKELKKLLNVKELVSVRTLKIGGENQYTLTFANGSQCVYSGEVCEDIFPLYWNRDTKGLNG